MTDNEFLRPKLVGRRFEGGVIPLEILGDFAELKELLIEAAKWKFMQANTSRKRSPRGFAKGIELKLTAVEEGSAIPVIALVLSTTTLFPPENATYMQQARDAVIDAIGDAGSKRPIRLPEHLLAYFDRFGRNLAEEEAIEFRTATTDSVARLDKATRRTLLLASAAIEEMTDTASLRGLIPEADQARRTFEVELSDGRKIRGPLTAQHRETIIDAFNGYSKRQRVLIDGVGRFNRSNRLIGIETIEQVTLLDPLDISARLDEIQNLKPGWLDGDGRVPDAGTLAWLQSAFEEHFPEDIAPPHLYPTPEGNISAEWSLQPLEVSLLIDLANMTADWHALNVDGDTERELCFDLKQASEWIRLSDEIRKLPGGQL